MSSTLSTVNSVRNELLERPYAAIDTEFETNPHNKEKPYSLFAVCLVDNKGKAEYRHVSDFDQGGQGEKSLVIWFMTKILEYQLTIGWYSKGMKQQKEDGTMTGKDSDLVVIDSVCQYYGIRSIVEYTMAGPYVRGYHSEQRNDPICTSFNRFSRYYHIDLYQVYKKPLIKSIIYRNTYKSLGLDAVSSAIIGEGKFQGLRGREIQKLSKQTQLEYVTQDTRLVMNLVHHNNLLILDLMNAISIITHVPFEKVCHSGIHSWWSRMLDKRIESGECRLPWYPHEEKRKYLGGLVLEPKRGFYEKQPVYVLDVKSLYPSMMINHNISFDTVNCECCKEDEVAKVSYNNIMKLINENLATTERRDTYWICKDRNYTGIIPRLLKQFRDERFKQQEIGNEPMQLALKNLINGCYGLFGSEGFRYADYRVAELTTAFGRETLMHMQQIAKEVYGFDIIYGDTDSIFVTNVTDENDIKKFIFECYILLNIDVELSDTYRKFLMVKKKHYIGIHVDHGKEPDIKGMEGIKSDRPFWINRIEKQLVEDIRNNIDPTKKIRDEYRAMQNNKVPLEELRIQLTLTKNPKEYKINSLQRIVGTELDASLGETIVYYKSTTAGGGTSNPNLISPRKYLQILQTSLAETINLLGYDYMREIVGNTKIPDYMSN